MMTKKLGIFSLLIATQAYAVGQEGRLVKHSEQGPEAAFQYLGTMISYGSGGPIEDADGDRVIDRIETQRNRIKTDVLGGSNDFETKIDAVSNLVGFLPVGYKSGQIPQPQNLVAEILQSKLKISEDAATLSSAIDGLGLIVSGTAPTATTTGCVQGQMKSVFKKMDGTEVGTLESQIDALQDLIKLDSTQSVEKNIQNAAISLGGTGDLKSAITDYSEAKLSKKIDPAAADILTACDNVVTAMLTATTLRTATPSTLLEICQRQAQKLSKNAISIKDGLAICNESIAGDPSNPLQTNLESFLTNKIDGSGATISGVNPTFDGRISALINAAIKSGYNTGDRTSSVAEQLDIGIKSISRSATTLKGAITDLGTSLGVTLSETNHAALAIQNIAKELGGSTATSLIDGSAAAAYNLAKTSLTTDATGSIDKIVLRLMQRVAAPIDPDTKTVRASLRDRLAAVGNNSVLISSSYALASKTVCNEIRTTNNALSTGTQYLNFTNIAVVADDFVGYANCLLSALQSCFRANQGSDAAAWTENSILRWRTNAGVVPAITQAQSDVLRGVGAADPKSIAGILKQVLINAGYAE